MNVELFIAKRMHFTKQQEENRKAPPVVHIAVAGIALGLAVMILAVSIVIGFKNEVRSMVVGFGSHIHISYFENNTSYETTPIPYTQALADTLASTEGIASYQRFATKPGILKTDSIVEGFVLKGVGAEYNLDFLRANLREGEIPRFDGESASNGALISHYLAERLQLRVGDSFLAYFFHEQVKARKFTVAGIYETGFSDYDKLFVVADLRHVQRLNGWSPDEIGGVEVTVKRYAELDAVADRLYFALEPITDSSGEMQYYVRSIKEISPQIFGWLDMLDLNVWVILILMTVVSGFVMISGLLIIILERTQTIGVLKALGAPDRTIRNIFLNIALFLIGKGMLYGNIIGISLITLQHFTHAIRLDPATYYLSHVPVEINLIYLLLLNVAALSITMLMLLLPSYIVARIDPARSIRFE